MEKSLGLVEVTGLSSAVEAADAMVKAANVALIGLEPARGNGMMTIKVTGDVGAVKAAVEVGKAAALACSAFVSADVIARPASSTGDFFERRPAPPVPKAVAVAERPAVKKQIKRRTRRKKTTPSKPSDRTKE
jgi:microcompartment protein CcmL/EutN